MIKFFLLWVMRRLEQLAPENGVGGDCFARFFRRISIVPPALLGMLLFIGSDCEDTTPPSQYVQTMFLTKDDSTTTEVWLRLKTDANTDRGTLKIIRRSEGIEQISVSSFERPRTGLATDTILYDDGLSPKRTYTYKAYRLMNNYVVDSSNALRVTTMDTTSHDFTWQIDTLGNIGSSILRDVAIINDTNVWVVGEIHTRGETWPSNAAYWNGREWDLKSILYTYEGHQFYSELYSVFIFNEHDFWIGSNQPMHWNGTQWEQFDVTADIFDSYIYKMWGSSSNNMYIVGRNGAIAHYDGVSWSKMESGTDVDLLDVWGTPDGSIVWACGWVDFKPTIVLRYENNVWSKVYEDPFPFNLRQDSLSGVLTSVWTPNQKRIYLCSDYGIYKCPENTKGKGERLSFVPQAFPGFPFRLRGNSENDMIIVGEYFMIVHYNGIGFRYYQELSGSGRLWSADQKGRIAVAVGYTFSSINSKGIVFIGRR